MRRQFDLPEGDADHLAARGLLWEALVEAGVRWLLIHDYPVPAGYNVSKARLALRLEPGYPDTQIDMAYFFPHLARPDGRGVGGLANQSLDGQQYQRWSRHRTGENPWRPGVDDLATHLLLVDDWLRREFGKGAA